MRGGNLLKDQISGTLYLVEPNDNLFDIASRFDTTVEKIKKINHLSSNLIKPGQYLIVDEIYDSDKLNFYQEYIVKPGDTIQSIAFKSLMTTDQLMEINNLLTDEIREGEILFIESNKMMPDKNIYHTVTSGDSIYSIAKAYHATLDELKKLNNLQDDNLTIGQSLLVLTKDTINKIKKQADIYYVQQGDNLFSIAQKTGTTVERLKAVNNLTDNNLKVGQLILVPPKH